MKTTLIGRSDPSIELGYTKAAANVAQPRKSIERYKRAKQRETTKLLKSEEARANVECAIPDFEESGMDYTSVTSDGKTEGDPSTFWGDAVISADDSNGKGCQTVVQTQNAACEASPEYAEFGTQTTVCVANASSQTDLTSEQIDDTVYQLKCAWDDCSALRQDVHNVSERLNNQSLTEDVFNNGNDKVKFYTGLPTFCLLKHVFSLVEKSVPYTPNNTLPKFRECLIFLMKLRLNVPHQDLAYRFGIHCATVSRIFGKWLLAMSYGLQNIIVWPDRKTLQTTMPLSFQKEFGKSVAVIIDCFEIFIERPSSLLPRSGTWSQYKHHNTVKILIGITPQGTISFISKAWVGRTSDKYLTEHSGLLDKLLPGDVILADRGFDIEESVGFQCAKLHIPAFTKGKSQLSFDDVELTRKLANLRIHVERVIGCVRQKYNILSGTLPIQYMRCKQGDTMATVDHIVRVCCALTNLCSPIVSME